MTKQELLDKLTDCHKPLDSEKDHGDCEEWLLEFIDDVDIAAAWYYRKSLVGWWYA